MPERYRILAGNAFPASKEKGRSNTLEVGLDIFGQQSALN